MAEEAFWGKDDDGHVHQFKWDRSCFKVTRNIGGTTGFATVLSSDSLDSVVRIHLCSQQPCIARWETSKHGKYGECCCGRVAIVMVTFGTVNHCATVGGLLACCCGRVAIVMVIFDAVSHCATMKGLLTCCCGRMIIVMAIFGAVSHCATVKSLLACCCRGVDRSRGRLRHREPLRYDEEPAHMLL